MVCWGRNGVVLEYPDDGSGASKEENRVFVEGREEARGVKLVHEWVPKEDLGGEMKMGMGFSGFQEIEWGRLIKDRKSLFDHSAGLCGRLFCKLELAAICFACPCEPWTGLEASLPRAFDRRSRILNFLINNIH